MKNFILGLNFAPLHCKYNNKYYSKDGKSKKSSKFGI